MFIQVELHPCQPCLEAHRSIDIKPSNILCNYRSTKAPAADPATRFSEIMLADLGSCVPATSIYAKEGDGIGAAIFRSPEASLHLPWGPSTDIWSFGATVSRNHTPLQR